MGSYSVPTCSKSTTYSKMSSWCYQTCARPKKKKTELRTEAAHVEHLQGLRRLVRGWGHRTYLSDEWVFGGVRWTSPTSRWDWSFLPVTKGQTSKFLPHGTMPLLEHNTDSPVLRTRLCENEHTAALQTQGVSVCSMVLSTELLRPTRGILNQVLHT